MIILGIDPGAKPGYAIGLASGAIETYPTWQAVLENSYGLQFDAIVTEGTWHARQQKGKRRGTPANIATLAFTCGLQVMRAHIYLNAPMYRFPVSIWKDAVIYRGGELLKEIFVSRLRKLERLGPDVSDDCVEAAGLVRAFQKLGPMKEVRQPK